MYFDGITSSEGLTQICLLQEEDEDDDLPKKDEL